MKYSRIYLVISALVLALLACQSLFGGSGDRDANDNPSPNDTGTLEPQEVQSTLPANNNNSIDTDFPMTADAYNGMDTGNGSILYYTKLSAEEAMDFYRQEYTGRGYIERETSTVVSDGIFSMVFDGDPSGKAVVIQSVEIGDGSRTISIRLEDV
jgi:hypothetical protein